MVRKINIMTAYNDDQLIVGKQYFNSSHTEYATLFEFIGENGSAIIMREVDVIPLSYHPLRKGYTGKWYK